MTLKVSLVVEAATSAAKAALDQIVATEKQIGDAGKTATAAAAEGIAKLNAAAYQGGKAQTVLRDAVVSVGKEVSVTQSIINGAAAATTTATAATKKHADEARGAAEATDRVAHSSTGARRELLVLAHELSQGNFSRFGGSLLVLGEQTDALGKLLTPTGLAVGAVVASIGALAVAAAKGAMEIQHLNNDVALTGNYAGITRDRYELAAKGISDSTNGHIAAARETLQGLIETGRFSGDALVPVGRAISNVAELSKASADDVLKDFSKLSDGVVKWAAEHNRQYHFLTLDEFDRIDALEKEGKTQEAIIATANALNASLESQKPPVEGLSKLWRGLGSSINSAWDALKNIGRGPSLDQQIASAQAALDQTRKALLAAQADAKANPNSRDEGLYANRLQSYLNDRQTEFQALLDKKALGEQKATADATKAQHDQEQIEAKQYVDRVVATYKTGGQALALAISEFNRRADLLAGTKDALSSSDRASVIAGIRKRFTPAGSTGPIDTAADTQRELKAQLDASVADLQAAVAARETTEAQALAQTRTLWANYYASVVGSLQDALANSGLTSKQRSKLDADLAVARAEAQAKDADLIRKQTDLARKGEADRAKTVADTAKSIGDARAAALLSLDARYTETLATLRNEGVKDAQTVADAWRNAQQIAIDVDSIAANVTSTVQRFRDRQLVAGARVNAGESTPAAARTSIANAAKEEIDQLTAARSQVLKLLDDYPDNPQLVRVLGTIDGELQQTGAIGQEVFRQISQGLQTDVVSFLDEVVTGTKNAGAAFEDLGLSILRTLAKVAEEAAANQFLQLLGLGGSGGGIGGGTAGSIGSGIGALFANNSTFSDVVQSLFLADGGPVSGPGSATSDSIPAMLSAGEYVLNAAAVRRVGTSFLDGLNGGGFSPPSVPKFAAGGLVGSNASYAGFTSGPTVIVDAKYDFRGAGPDEIGRLLQYGEKIKRDTMRDVFDMLKRGTAPVKP